MKEITREDWLKNPKPRKMWVWDDAFRNKEMHLVVHCLSSGSVYKSFVAEHENGRTVDYWRHCAEIDEPQFRRMTNREVAWWLRVHPEELREWRYRDATMVFHDYSYAFEEENEPCGDIEIRGNGREWYEPLVEVEE